jgi:hypothetical protein
MNGAKPLLPLLASMAWTATPLLLLSPRSPINRLIDGLGVDFLYRDIPLTVPSFKKIHSRRGNRQTLTAG